MRYWVRKFGLFAGRADMKIQLSDALQGRLDLVERKVKLPAKQFQILERVYGSVSKALNHLLAISDELKLEWLPPLPEKFLKAYKQLAEYRIKTGRKYLDKQIAIRLIAFGLEISQETANKKLEIMRHYGLVKVVTQGLHSITIFVPINQDEFDDMRI